MGRTPPLRFGEGQGWGQTDLTPRPFPEREWGELPSPFRGGAGVGSNSPNPPAPFPEREWGELPSPFRGGAGVGSN